MAEVEEMDFQWLLLRIGFIFGFMLLIFGIRWLVKRRKGKFRNLFQRPKLFPRFKEKKILIPIIVLILALIVVGIWWFISWQHANTNEGKYERAFIEEVLPNIKEGILSLDALVKRVENSEIERIYRQFRPQESATIIKYYVKLKGEDGYYLAYVPSNFTVYVSMGLGGAQMTLDTYLAQVEEATCVFVMTTDPKAPMAKENFIFIGIFLVIFVLFFYFIWFRMLRGGGYTKAKTQGEMKTPVYFKDVGGADEAIEQCQEPVQYLKDPTPFLELNARVPHGFLLFGPPGTGKTLLARAIAWESDAHIEMISGSAFHEMFIGVGSGRARDLFARAEKYQPSIIILDEADSAAPKRGGAVQIHEESVGLVNQLLSLLDRVEKENLSVYLIAITNRPDMLDPAFLRAGRLDRHIEVPHPTLEGRIAILKIHLTRPKIRPIDFDIEGTDNTILAIAQETPGFSGADIKNLTNEAALRAVREKRKTITLDDFHQSIETVLMGAIRKLKISKKEMEMIAWHEAGHALVAMLLPETDPIHIVTILPRGRSLGHTRLLPVDDRYLISQTRIFNQIKYGLGGRVAEKIRFEELSTGAAGDIKMVTSIARTAVCAYGMSELGPITIDDPSNPYFPSLWSNWMREEVDKEVRGLIDNCCQEALSLLKENQDKLDKLAEALLKSEKKRLLGSEVYELFPDLKPKILE